MNNRELKDKVSNIQAIQAFVRENEHYYDAVVHGMSELSAVEFELISALRADIHMELALYLYFNTVFSFYADVALLADKTVTANNISSFNAAVKFIALKYLSAESAGAVTSYIRPVVFRAVPVSMPGLNGKDGVSPTVSVAETVTDESGAEAKVENIGTATDLMLKFTIPQGKQGPPGTSSGGSGESGNSFTALDDMEIAAGRHRPESGGWITVTFDRPFTEIPVVTAQGNASIHFVQVRNITRESFQYMCSAIRIVTIDGGASSTVVIDNVFTTYSTDPETEITTMTQNAVINYTATADIGGRFVDGT